MSVEKHIQLIKGRYDAVTALDLGKGEGRLPPERPLADRQPANTFRPRLPLHGPHHDPLLADESPGRHPHALPGLPPDERQGNAATQAAPLSVVHPDQFPPPSLY